MRFSGAPCLAGVVRVERDFLGVGVALLSRVMKGFSFSSVSSFRTTRRFARVDADGESVSMVLRVRFPKSIVSAIAASRVIMQLGRQVLAGCCCWLLGWVVWKELMLRQAA